jgi:hypothetical protein
VGRAENQGEEMTKLSDVLTSEVQVETIADSDLQTAPMYLAVLQVKYLRSIRHRLGILVLALVIAPAILGACTVLF